MGVRKRIKVKEIYSFVSDWEQPRKRSASKMRAAFPKSKMRRAAHCACSRIFHFAVFLLFGVVAFLCLNGVYQFSLFTLNKSGLLTILSGTSSTHQASWEAFSYKSCILPEHYSSYSLFRTKLKGEKEGKYLDEGVDKLPSLSAPPETIRNDGDAEQNGNKAGPSQSAGDGSASEEKVNAGDGLVDQIVFVVIDALRPDYIFPQLSLQGFSDGCGMKATNGNRVKPYQGNGDDTENFLFDSTHEKNAKRDFCPVEWNEDLCVVQKETKNGGGSYGSHQAALSNAAGCDVTPSQLFSFIQQHLMEPADASIGLFSFADYPTSTAQRLAAIASGIVPPLIQAFTENIFILSPAQRDRTRAAVQDWPQHCSPACCGRHQTKMKNWTVELKGKDEGGDTSTSVSGISGTDEIYGFATGNTTCQCPCRSPSLSRRMFPDTEGVSRDSLLFQLDGRASCVGDDTLSRLFSSVDSRGDDEGKPSGDSHKEEKKIHNNLFWKEIFGIYSFDVNDLDSGDDLVELKIHDMLQRETPESSGGTSDSVLLNELEKGMKGNKSTNASLHAKLVIAHVLGLDHVGHSLGKTVGPEMVARVKRIDNILFKISNALLSRKTSMRTLLIVAGDHGATRRGAHGGNELSAKGTFAFAKYYSPTIGKYASSSASGTQRSNSPRASGSLPEGQRSRCTTTRSSVNSSSAMPLTTFQQQKLAELIQERRRQNLDADLQVLLETCLWDQHVSSELESNRAEPSYWSSLSASLSPLFPFPHKISASYQIDWTATMALLLGIPIPHDNVGRVIPEVTALVHYSRWNEVFSRSGMLEQGGTDRGPESQGTGRDENVDDGKHSNEEQWKEQMHMADKLSFSSFLWLSSRWEYCNWRQVSKIIAVQGEGKGEDGISHLPAFEDAPASISPIRPVDGAGTTEDSSLHPAPGETRNGAGEKDDVSGAIKTDDFSLSTYSETGFLSFLLEGKHRYVDYRRQLAHSAGQRHVNYSLFSEFKLQLLWVWAVFVVSAAGAYRLYCLYRRGLSPQEHPSRGKPASRFWPLPAAFLWVSLLELTLWISTQSYGIAYVEDTMLKCLLLMHLVVANALLGTWEIRPMRCALFWLGTYMSYITRRSYDEVEVLVSVTPLEVWSGRWWPAETPFQRFEEKAIFVVLFRCLHIPFLIVAFFWWLDMFSHSVSAVGGRSLLSRFLQLLPWARRDRGGRNEDERKDWMECRKKKYSSSTYFVDYRTSFPFIVAVLMGVARDVIYLHYIVLITLAIWGPRLSRPRNQRKAMRSIEDTGKSESEKENTISLSAWSEKENAKCLQPSPVIFDPVSDYDRSAHGLFTKKFRYYMAVMWIVSLYDFTPDNRTGAIVAALHGSLLPPFFFTFLGLGSKLGMDGDTDSQGIPLCGSAFYNFVSVRLPRVLTMVSFSSPPVLWMSAALVYLTALYGFYISGQQCTFETLDMRASAVGVPSDSQLTATLQSLSFRFLIVPEESLFNFVHCFKIFIGGCAMFFRAFYPILLALPAFEISGVLRRSKATSSSNANARTTGCLPHLLPRFSDKGMRDVIEMKAVVEVVLLFGVVFIAGTSLNCVWNYSLPHFTSVVLLRVIFEVVKLLALFVSVLFTDLNSIPSWAWKVRTRLSSLFVSLSLVIWRATVAKCKKLFNQ